MSHTAIVVATPGAPLETRQLPTPKPQGNQVLLRNEWTATEPLDMHRANGLMPSASAFVTGGVSVGEVIEMGDQVETLRVGDKVFGYAWRSQEEKGNQLHPVIPENLLAKLPSNITPEEAATVPTNFVTVFHTCITVLDLALPWPKPASYSPPSAGSPILIWGGASSVGQYTIQILTYYGYSNLVVVASSKHRNNLTSLGATSFYDYNHADVIAKIEAEVGHVPYFIDCIGSAEGSVAPISKLARAGSKVAVLLPVILPTPTTTSLPEYTFDAQGAALWNEGVEVSGVRTHNYLDNKLLARLLQPQIMPELLRSGAVKPNRYRVVDGASMLERAQRAMNIMRAGVSGEKLVWRVDDSIDQ